MKKRKTRIQDGRQGAAASARELMTAEMIQRSIKLDKPAASSSAMTARIRILETIIVIVQSSLSQARPLKPQNAMAISAALSSTMGAPWNALGMFSLYASRSRIPARMTMAMV